MKWLWQGLDTPNTHFLPFLYPAETIHVAKPEWGTKRLCPGCGERFYDMKRKPVSCPSCNSAVSVEPLLKPRRPAPAKEAPAPVKVEAKAKINDLDDDDDDDDDDVIDEVAAIADVEDIEDDDDDDDALIVDDTDLEEDDDIPEIKEHTDEDLNTGG